MHKPVIAVFGSGGSVGAGDLDQRRAQDRHRRTENYYPRDAGLRCLDETAPGHPGSAQAHHSRYPDALSTQMGPLEGAVDFVGLAPRAMPGDHLVRIRSISSPNR